MKLVSEEQKIEEIKVEDPKPLIRTAEDIAKENAELDQIGPYLLYAGKTPDEKLQRALSVEDSLRVSFGIQPFTRVMDLANQILLPVFRLKHAPRGSQVQTFDIDPDDRLLRSNVILTMLRQGLR